MTRKSIYVLSTGGTIGMQKTAQGLMLHPGYLAKAMAKLPELQNPDMPHYTIHEYANPIDSANMTVEQWQEIALHIQNHYDEYDGFVILHGTDTMAYSASALSFILENLNKPVILTGSQLPLFETRNDARDNLINALWLANNYQLPEVCVYFNNKLFRGNRCKKVDASRFAAFASPNFPVLGKIGTEVRLRHDLILKGSSQKLGLSHLKSTVISTLRIFPGMSLTTVESLLTKPLHALIIETYGTGTAPESAPFLDLLSQAIARGVIVINCSQCYHANVNMRNYPAGKALLERGVVSGADMTIEAILAKLFYLFSKELSLDQLKNQMITDLRGEITN